MKEREREREKLYMHQGLFWGFLCHACLILPLVHGILETSILEEEKRRKNGGGG